MEGSVDKSRKKKYKSPKYCCVCKGVYRGTVINGRTVSLHRFPKNKQLKRVWIQRCKTVMRKRLCSEHFVDFGGPTLQYTLPTFFPTERGERKEFPTWKLDENQCDIDDDDSDGVVESDHIIEDDEGDAGQDTPTHLNISSECHSLAVSICLHDYCLGSVDTSHSARTRCMDTQTECDQRVAEVQTDDSTIKKTRDFCHQTEPQTKECGVQCNLPVLTFEDVKHNDNLVSFYTGIPSREVFEAVFDEIKDEAELRTSRRKANYNPKAGGRPRTLSTIDEFFMVLMRLRLGLLLEDLSSRFCISTSQCSDIVDRWINYLVVQLSFLVQWPSMETIKANMPSCFKEKFPKTRVIIDCTELYSETASSLSLKSLMYSNYKSHMTHKALVGISPNGVVTFVSDCWVGSTSDRKLTEKCGLLELMEEGDAIMADKGFTISDLTTAKAVHLIIPPFKQKGKQFSKREVFMTKDIASLRIHVERQMERIKNSAYCKAIYPLHKAGKFPSCLRFVHT